MFRAPETGKSDPELEARLRQSFGRLREQPVGGLGPQSPESGAEDGEIREPSLPAKLFIGPNATWYDDRWRWMDWRGRKRNWNWAAAATFGAWFGYRRMYGWLVAHGAVTLAALALILIGMPLLIPLVLLLATSVLAGLYGNYLYLSHFRRHAGRIAECYDDHDSQVEAVEQAGGVDRRMIWLWPGLVLLAGTSIGAIVRFAGLGPSINLGALP